MKPMRSEKEMLDLIVGVAESDERIRAVIMSGSRAIPDVPKDIFQDYDICYFVKDIEPFYNNMEWIREKFGNPIIFQLPEDMELMPPNGDGHFCSLMIFEDGNRIDLSIDFTPYIDDGEPVTVLLDKDEQNGFVPPISVNPSFFHIKKPKEELYNDCCNEFWWCLNNVAKGIARDELPYAMEMLNSIVRDMLKEMITWYIGIKTDFSVSSGKMGKYFKRYLDPRLYETYCKTYSDSDYDNLWEAVFIMCGLFREVAEQVAAHFGYKYPCKDDENMMNYLKWVRNISGEGK